MGVIKRQAFQSSIVLYIGVIIGFLTTGIMAPNLLSKSEIGTLRLLQSYSAIFMSFGILGFNTITLRFIPQFYNKAKNNYNGFLGISILFGTIGSLLATVIILIIQPNIIQNNIDKSKEFAQFFLLIIPLTIFQIFYSLLDSYNNALMRSSIGVFLRDFVQRIFILGGLVMVFLKVIGFEVYTYYFVSAICFPTILILIDIIKTGSFNFKINTSFLNKDLIRSMTSVGFFGILNTFSFIAVMQIDTIMLNMYLDSTAVGVYAITFYFGTLVMIPSKAVNKIAPTLIAKAYKEDDIETVRDIHYRSTGNLFLIGILILLGLAVNLDNVFNIIPTYEEGKYVILLIGLANLIKMMAGSSDSVITFSRYYRVTTIFLFVLVAMIIGFNFLLIPKYGMNGAAAASCLAILLHNLIKYTFIRIKFGFNPYNIQYGLIAVICLIIFYMVSLLPIIDNFILEIIIDSVVATVLFYFGIQFFSIADEANQFAKQIVTKGIKLFESKFK